jgi:2,3-bisphosphoglycerate-dependent phosphoglycerate mutase
VRTVYLVVHPEATHHVNGVVGGWHDSQLTPAGASAAMSIARSLRANIGEDVEVELFSSDLQRAAQTAKTVGELLHVEPIFDKRLREKSYGEAEGRPQKWLDQRFIPPPSAGNRMRHDEGIHGAETRAAFAQRLYAAMDAILESHCAHQVIVTHGFAITFLVASWIRMPIESVGYVNFRATSGSITVLCEDDYFHNRQVVSLGDVSHLAT